ncbi:MAG: PTS sugar transporter subunit IIA [Gemmatimonadetes bacterium]|nr:PTS sugar transporter subunit IIA [Gemmatimonadota bacterium]
MFVGIVVSTIVSSLVVAPWLTWSIRRRAAVNILSFFDRSATIPNLTSRSKWEALEELCGGVRLETNSIGADECAAAVREREEQAGTGTGHGLAVPHARLPGLTRPVLVLGRSPGGIDWDAPDGLPVHLIFLILTPEENTGLQLQILAGLAGGLHPRPARERLIKAESDKEVWEALGDALRSQRLIQVT